MCGGRTYPRLFPNLPYLFQTYPIFSRPGVTLDVPGLPAVVIFGFLIPGRTRLKCIPAGSPRRRGHGGGARLCVAAVPAEVCVKMPCGQRVIFCYQQGVYRWRGILKTVIVVWSARRGRRFWRGCAGVTAQLTLYLPYLFSKLTLDFLTNPATVPATGGRHRRDIYHTIEKKKGYRLVYIMGACGPRGGRGGDVCA